MKSLPLLLFLAAGVCAVQAQSVPVARNGVEAAAVVSSEFIYERAPFASCHATTIAESGRALVAAWFGGTREGDPDVGIWFSRSLNGGWSAPVEVANGEGVGPDGARVRHPAWNPVLFQAKRGPLLLFYKVGPTPARWRGFLKRSMDGGLTWSAAEPLPEGFVGPVKNKPVELVDGTLLCPASLETAEKPSRWQVQFESTADLGKTWRKTGLLNDGLEIAAIQPSVLFLGGERLLALGRTRQGRVFSMASENLGRDWSPMQLTELANPNSGTDAVTLEDGRHVLVYNPVAKGRTPLVVAVSADGLAWKEALVLESEPGEYSYPAVIQSGDGRVHVTYTWRRQRVRHVVLDPARLGIVP
jgi:predicted neuraminidase